MATTFHANGEARLRRAFRVRVRSEVLGELEPVLAAASWWRRWIVLARARREVRRRVAKLMPEEAHYLRSR